MKTFILFLTFILMGFFPSVRSYAEATCREGWDINPFSGQCEELPGQKPKAQEEPKTKKTAPKKKVSKPKAKSESGAESSDQGKFEQMCKDLPDKISNTESKLTDEKICVIKSTQKSAPDKFLDNIKFALMDTTFNNNDFCTLAHWMPSNKFWTSSCAQFNFELKFVTDNIECPDRSKFNDAKGTCDAGENNSATGDDWAALRADAQKVVDKYKEINEKLQKTEEK